MRDLTTWMTGNLIVYSIKGQRNKIFKKQMYDFKTDKGQGIVIVNKKDYFQSLDRLFNDKNKFEILEEDQTLRNLNTIQNLVPCTNVEKLLKMRRN